MSEKKITMFSTRGRNFIKNLELVRNGFCRINQDIVIDFYIANFVPSTKVLKTENALGEELLYKDLIDERNCYACSSGSILCDDISISAKNLPSGQKRILIMEPFDYLFKKIYERQYMNVYKARTSLKAYTDVISYGRYWSENLDNYYDLSKSSLHEHMGVPFADALNDAQICKKVRESAKQYFPEIANKKVISIFTSSVEQKGSFTSFININLKKILENLPPEWIIITNNQFIAQKCSILPSAMRDRIIFTTNRFFAPEDLLYITNLLLSDMSHLICNYSSTGHPFYVVDYSDSYFSKYIINAYPDLMLRDFSYLSDLTAAESLTPVQKEFCGQFAPPVTGNSIESLYDLFFKNI